MQNPCTVYVIPLSLRKEKSAWRSLVVKPVQLSEHWMPNFLASHMDRRLAGVPLPALALPTLHRLPWIKNNHKTRFKELAIKEIQDWENLLQAALEKNTRTEMSSIYRRLYLS